MGAAAIKYTYCEKCKKELQYTTKKKRWCPDCNPYKDVIVYKSGPKVPTKSQTEFNVQGWLPELTDRPFIVGGYFSWLKSERGYPLQLDFLVYGGGFESFALEIDGPQHYKRQCFQTQEEFDILVTHDRLKEQIMANLGIKLIRITECNSKDQLLDILLDNGCQL